MANEIERKGIPTAYFTAIPSIPLALGTARVIVGTAVTNVLGDPNLPTESERQLRRRLLLTGLRAIQTPVAEPRLFELEDKA
jgi:glycine/betaine/sarcosine/D-proline reductase family selenoprotein B